MRKRQQQQQQQQQQQMFYLLESEAAATKRLAGTEINPRYGDQQIIEAHFSNNRIGEMSLFLLKKLLSFK